MTADKALAAEVRLLLNLIDRGEQKLNPIRGETEGAPPEDMEARLRRALAEYERENS
jgi:hypothetical protein